MEPVVIRKTPNEKGEIIITLYGIKYKIIIEGEANGRKETNRKTKKIH